MDLFIPKDALTEAAKTLIHHFLLFSDERITLEADEIAQAETTMKNHCICVSC
jgi:hypothetical protein